MARKSTHSTFWFDANDTTWLLTGTVVFPRASTNYLDPPDPGDVEIHTVEEELDDGFQGPCRKFDFDTFLTHIGASASDADDMQQKLAEEAADFDDCEDESEPDLDDVHPEYHDALDRFDIEY